MKTKTKDTKNGWAIIDTLKSHDTPYEVKEYCHFGNCIDRMRFDDKQSAIDYYNSK